MHQNIIFTLTAGLSVALVMGFITQKMRLSPIVGYLLAGMIVGPFTPGIDANVSIAEQFSEIGIILLMFGVGLHFHLKDLLAVKNIALPGAVAQIAVTTVFSMFLAHFMGWGWSAGIVFGIAIAVASTVVLTRVLADNHNLHTPTGHLAVGWLIVEDLFTIFILVLLPAFFTQTNHSGAMVWSAFVITLIKLSALVIFVFAFGKKILPSILSYVAKTGARDLFTLVILVLALGMAVGAAQFFGASIALGAFLAGIVVGQSDFSARAASEALPMRDAFAVLFFVSVGMLFNPATLTGNWKLVLATLFIVLIIKPLAAVAVVKLLKQPLSKALSVGVALAQIGEFSFILAGLGISLHVLPTAAGSAIIAAAIISITLNPLLYKGITPFLNFLQKRENKKFKNATSEHKLTFASDKNRIIIIGYGPVGKAVTKILLLGDFDIIVIEMNIDTVKEIQNKKEQSLFAVHGDAAKREILHYAGTEHAHALIISAPSAPANEIIELARSLNPNIEIIVHSNYIQDTQKLKKNGANAVFSGEGAVAVELSKYLMCDFGIMDEEFERECKRLNSEQF